MRKLYVIDTNALISFFDSTFQHADNYKGSLELSKYVKTIISEAIFSKSTAVRLSIPTVVFIEIYEKWLRSEEFCRMFYYEVFLPLKQSENIEIRPMDREVLDNLLNIGSPLGDHDLHDRLVLASAMALEASLITIDPKIIEYVRRNRVVKKILY